MQLTSNYLHCSFVIWCLYGGYKTNMIQSMLCGFSCVSNLLTFTGIAVQTLVDTIFTSTLA